MSGEKKEMLRAFKKRVTCLTMASLISLMPAASPAFAAWYDNENTCLDRGRQAYNSGQFDQALKDLNESIKFNPKLADAYYWRGITHSAMKQWDAALNDLDQAIKLAPDSANCYMSRGLVFSSQGKHQQAISDFEEALKRDPDLVDARTNKNYSQSQLDKLDKLDKSSQAATVATNPGHTSSTGNLADLLKPRQSNQAVNDPKWLAMQAQIEAKARKEKMQADQIAAQRAKAEIAAAEASARLEAQRKAREEAELRRLALAKEKSQAAEAAGTSATAIAAATPGSGKASNKQTRDAQAASASPDNDAAESALAIVNRPVRDKWAIVIGISKFQDEKLNLHYPAKDATDFYNFLVKEANFSADHVKLLTNEQATRGRILSEIGDKWLPRVANPDDLVLIYFSSHGSASDMDIGGVNYLLAYDSQVDSLFSTGLPMQDLTRIIKGRVHSDRVVLVLDACHSGAADAGAKGLFRKGNLDADEVAQGTGQLVISSSSPSQVSWESKKYENSVFTRCLIESLRKNGAATTLGEAFQNMKDTVQEQVLRERGVMQTPVLKSRWKGNDLKISVPPSNPRPSLAADE